MKKFVRILFIFLLLILILLAGSYFYARQMVSPVSKGDSQKTVRVEIPYGMSVYNVSILLEKEGLIKNQKIFYYTARYPQLKKLLFPGKTDLSFNLKSGIYYISDNMDTADIQTLLSSGQQEYIKISVPEGYTISQIGELLEENKICSCSDFAAVCKGSEITARYNIPGDSCEGYLFPDTYFLTAGMSADSVADLMIDNFFEKIKSVPNLAEMNSDDLFYTVRLASIVEREYRVEDEAPLIASVFKNRLKKNIGLYSCATIVYILTEIEGRPHPDRILIEDTKIDSPYNTYKWAGLPPGAISNPGLVALNAATNTPKTNYYFFQVADEAEGRHVFTSTFDEHVENHNLTTKKASGK